MKILFKSLITLVVFAIIFSCSKSTFVGSDLFVPESIELFFKDDFEITAKTIKTDSVVTFDLLSYMSSLICGKIEDPVFGTSEAEIYIDLHVASDYPPFNYIESGSVKEVIIDSVVLVLGYDPATFYGDSTVSHDVEVSLLQRELIFKDTVYSNFSPAVTSTILGRKTFVPNYSDSIKVVEAGDTTTTAYSQMLRIRLDNSFAEAMVADTSLINTDTKFVKYAPGLRIKSTPNGNSFWGIDTGKTATAPYNSIIIYYTKGLEKLSYRIFVDGERTNYFKNDYVSSQIEPFFGSEEKGDSLLFMQGMAGPDIEINIPALADPFYNDFLINKAELEFFVLEDENSSLFDPLESVVLYRYDSFGKAIVTEDVYIAFSVLQDESFDGLLKNRIIDGKTLKKYSAVMSVHALRMFNSANPDTRVVISARNKKIRPNRSIIYGPGHSKYPMKFKLTYSK